MKEKILELLKEVKRPGMDTLIDFLNNSDFFRAPASSAFHLNYEGGLAEHVYNVYTALEGIAKKYSPETTRESVIICGIFHDLCKTNVYVRDLRNKKIDGKWVSEEYWKFDDKDPLGHGEKSVIMLQDHIKLTKDEQYAIRFHMGPWNEETHMQRQTLNSAMNKCMLLKCLMVADQVATFFLEADKK